jgi:threonine/homoserine efflux transporter RhtA
MIGTPTISRLKPFWKSKTNWASIASIVVGAVASIGSIVFGHEIFSVEEQTAIVLVIVGVIGLVLRFATKEPISL